MKKTVHAVDVADKRVLVRCDFNVPLSEGRVQDDTRIRAALPTIMHLMYEGARVILCSHLGRPGGRVDESLRLDPVRDRLAELTDLEVLKMDDSVGEAVEEAVRYLEPGKMMLLENTRFHPEEEKNDPEFARKLAALAELFVNDAFGSAHRAHASTEGVARYLPAVAGHLMEKELKALKGIVGQPKRPFAAIFGGAKISDKIPVIERLLDRLDRILCGGGMANTLLKAKGLETGHSLVEKKGLEAARHILNRAGEKLFLPVDLVITDDPEGKGMSETVFPEKVSPGNYVVDIGPGSLSAFRQTLNAVETVVWNGPMGLYEKPPFDRGTVELARTVADLSAVTVVGGGDTLAAVLHRVSADAFTHVSTGGGAFMAFLEGRELPGVRVLDDMA